MKDIILTKEGYQKLKREIEDLSTRRRREIADRIKVAREFGDIAENAEYDAAKNEQALMEARIRNLEAMLRDPEIVESPPSSEVVSAGMLVTLRPLDDPDEGEETYLLAESSEERAAGVRTITTTSPLGRTLVGRSLDDEVEYEAPGGVFKYLIVKFEPRG